jgi:parallel beta-helix repeat protein
MLYLRTLFALLAMAGILGGALLAGGRTASAATLVVDENDAGCDDTAGTPYCTIQAAVDDALQGDTIEVRNGDYDEEVTINVNALTIIGEDRQDTAIDGDDTYTTVSVLSNNVTISNLTIRNGAPINLHVAGNRFTLDRVTVQGANESNIYVTGDRFNMLNSASRSAAFACVEVDFADRARIQNSRIKGCGSYGIYIVGDLPRVATSRVQQVGDGPAIYLYDPDTTTVQGAIVRDNLIRAVYEGLVIEIGSGARILRNEILTVDDDGIDVTGDNTLVDSNVVNGPLDAISVYAESAGNQTVTNNVVSAESDCIYVESDNTLISANTVGPCPGSYPISYNGNEVTISDNTIFDANHEGIDSDGGGLHTITGNTIRNTSGGISVTADDTLVQGNDIRNVALDGISADLTGGGIIDDNTIVHAGWTGIDVADDGTLRVRNNTVMFTCEGGIDVFAGAAAIVSGNNVSGVLCSDYDAIYVEATNSQVTGNTASIGPGGGIEVSDSGNATVSGNTVSSFLWDGIDITASGAIQVNDNTISFINDDNGIDVSGTNVTATGNDVQNTAYASVYILDDGSTVFNSNIAMYVQGNEPNVYIEASGGVTAAGNTLAHNSSSEFALEVFAGGPVVIDANDISHTPGGMSVVNNGSTTEITNNTLADHLELDGIFVQADNAEVRGNTVERVNGGDGMDITGANFVIEGNTVRDSEFAGIWGHTGVSCDGAVVRDNVVTGARGAGILVGCVAGSAPGLGLLVEGNSVGNGAENGILVDGDGVLVRLNLVEQNGHAEVFGAGIYVLGNNNTITNNIARNGSTSGIMLDGQGNTASFNEVYGNDHDGIEVVDGGNLNVVTGNDVDANGYEGIDNDVGVTNTTITNNTSALNGNADYVDNGTGTTCTGNLSSDGTGDLDGGNCGAGGQDID